MVIRAILIALAIAATLCAQPLVVFVTGDHEYGGEETMPLLARALEQRYRLRTTILYATRPDGQRDHNYEENIAGLEKLREADAAVFFLRWRRLPAAQVAEIDRYLKSGKPLLGLRTASHSFNYPKDHELARWNAFGELAFGTPPGWGAAGHTHCGHNCSTDVAIDSAAATHPILRGIDKSFHVRSWLYNVLPKYPPADAQILLRGTAITPNKPMVDNPVAWTWKTAQGARSFYTSLGHPEDFKVESVQRLLVNAIHWALGKDVPARWDGKIDIDVAYHGIRPAPPK